MLLVAHATNAVEALTEFAATALNITLFKLMRPEQNYSTFPAGFDVSQTLRTAYVWGSAACESSAFFCTDAYLERSNGSIRSKTHEPAGWRMYQRRYDVEKFEHPPVTITLLIRGLRGWSSLGG